jgi:hypothetical protein
MVHNISIPCFLMGFFLPDGDERCFPITGCDFSHSEHSISV